MEENRILTDENGIRHCTQCPNQCPETALKCGRGRKLFGVQSDDAKEGEGRGEQEHGQDHAHHEHHEHGHGHEHPDHRHEHGHHHGHEDIQEQ